MRYRVMLAVVTVAAASLALTLPAMGQSVCYRPDGSMYIGRERPADCSSVRPKSRDEDVQRRIESEAAGRAERDAALRAKQAEEQKIIRRAEERQIDEEARERVLSKFERAEERANARKAIRSCNAYKDRPEAMNAEHAALCNQFWQEKASRTLRMK
jgi:hypothetical protein